MTGGWGCPHEQHGTCTHVAGRPCDPGMKGCVLSGRFRFADPAKNRPPKGQPKAATPQGTPTPSSGPDLKPGSAD